jgi:hypothetical protein
MFALCRSLTNITADQLLRHVLEVASFSALRAAVLSALLRFSSVSSLIH